MAWECFSCPATPLRGPIVKGRLEKLIYEEGLSCLGWRDVPVDVSSLGNISRSVMPHISQLFIGKGPSASVLGLDEMAFERRLYVVRKRAEKSLEGRNESSADYFYFASLSCKTIVYKGMFTSEQVEPFYLDLSHPAFESSLSVVHSRFSTNTFPSWERAHPYRYLIHNGEINTLRGNVNWMHARESMIKTDLFGPDVARIMPIINASGSDSAMFDNCLEFLYLTGRPLSHAMMMMIPEPWSGHESMSDEKKAFYEYHATMIEPWDGPAAMAFTDGSSVGAVLDRNGLRPARYYVTLDDTVILASEVGVLDIPADRIVRKERLQPGRMLLIDTKEGRIIDDEEIKERAACEHPYREWLDEHMISLEELPPPPRHAEPDHETVLRLEKAFGYTYEDERQVLIPMVRDGVDPVGSMGNDTPLAVLSDKPQLLYNYFKQLFAQVTNPPIDAIREEIVIGPETFMGSEGDLVHPTPEAARQIKLSSPFIDNDELETVAPHNPDGIQGRDHSHHLQGDRRRLGRGRRGPGAGDEPGLRRGRQGFRRGLQHPHPLGSRREQGDDSRPRPPRGVRPAPPPDPQRDENTSLSRPGIGRASGNPPFLDADRLRRIGHQSLSRLRGDRRHDQDGPSCPSSRTIRR